MSTLGIVASFLNLLLAVFFVFLTAPVVNYRIEKQKQIADEKKKIAPLQEEVHLLERERVKIKQDTNRVAGEITAAIADGQTMKSDFQVRVATLTDVISDHKAKEAAWSKSVADVKSEIEARTQEKAGLEESIAKDEGVAAEIQGQVSKLETDLQTAQQDLEATRQAITDNYAKLLTLEDKVADRTPSAKLVEKN